MDECTLVRREKFVYYETLKSTETTEKNVSGQWSMVNCTGIAQSAERMA